MTYGTITEFFPLWFAFGPWEIAGPSLIGLVGNIIEKAYVQHLNGLKRRRESGSGSGSGVLAIVAARASEKGRAMEEIRVATAEVIVKMTAMKMVATSSTLSEIVVTWFLIQFAPSQYCGLYRAHRYQRSGPYILFPLSFSSLPWSSVVFLHILLIYEAHQRFKGESMDTRKFPSNHNSFFARQKWKG